MAKSLFNSGVAFVDIPAGSEVERLFVVQETDGNERVEIITRVKPVADPVVLLSVGVER